MVDLPGAPLGPPDDFGELLDMQFEMFALAWQTNRTRVATMKMVEEASMRTYPNLGVHEAFHPTSHWGGFPERVANLRLIQNYHTAVFAKFVQRLKEMQDGDGSVLDHSIILFGSNMANSDAHNNDPLPQALIGRGGGVKGNQHLHYQQDTPAREHPGDDAATARACRSKRSRSSPTPPARSRKCDREGLLDAGSNECRCRGAGGA